MKTMTVTLGTETREVPYEDFVVQDTRYDVVYALAVREAGEHLARQIDEDLMKALNTI